MMSKNKKFIFWLIILLTLSIIFSPYLLNKFNESKQEELKKMVKVADTYQIGKDIVAGTYDLEAKGSVMNVVGIELYDGGKLLGIELLEGSQLVIEGKGKLYLYPAEFQRLQPSADGSYEIHYSGTYLIDDIQIPSGRYQLSYRGQTEEDYPFIRYLNHQAKLIEEFHFHNTTSYEVFFEKGTVLKVFKNLTKENKNLTILLIPI